MCNTLYVKLTHHPIFELIGILTLKPQQVVLLTPRGAQPSYDSEKLMTYFERRSGSKIQMKTLDFTIRTEVEALSKSIRPEDAVLLTGLDQIEDLTFFQSLTFKGTSIYFVEPDGEIWHLKDGHTTSIDPVSIELSDYFQSVGGRILHDEKQFYVHSAYDDILSWIRSHYEIWTSVKGILRNPSQTKSIPETPLISIQKSSPQLEKWLNYLKELGIAEVKYNPSKILIRFKHRHFKEYFMKFGMWFEHMVYTLIQQNHLLDSVNTGVLFSWDTSQNLVKNELDVVGLSDNRLVIISCKDTTNINEHALNEIALYTEGLAESASIKILASTGALNQTHLKARADSLDIHLLEFTGDEQGFIKDIKKLLSQS